MLVVGEDGKGDGIVKERWGTVVVCGEGIRDGRDERII